MVGLAWYAPLGGALILGAFVFALARFQQWRFERRHGREPESLGAETEKATRHHA